jgi:hypothetical protein
MNRLQIKTTARKKLGEATAVFFEDTDLNQWIEDAQIDIVWKSRCKRQRLLCNTLPASVTNGIATNLRYVLTTLLPDCLRIISIRIYSNQLLKWRRLFEKDYDFLDDRYPQWQSNDPATPLYYIYDREINEFILFPMPQTDYVGTGYLEAYYSPLPTPLTADDQSIVDIPIQLQPTIIEYIVATGLEARGYQDIADGHWNKYETKINSYIAQRGIQEDEEICMRGSR